MYYYSGHILFYTEFTKKYKECLMPSLDLPILNGDAMLSEVISVPGTSGILLRYIAVLVSYIYSGIHLIVLFL